MAGNYSIVPEFPGKPVLADSPGVFLETDCQQYTPDLPVGHPEDTPDAKQEFAQKEQAPISRMSTAVIHN